MRRRLTATVLWLLATVASAATPSLRIDTARSHADFSVRILWIHTMHGQFRRVDGTLLRDADGRVRVDASIEVSSARLSRPRYTRMLLSDDFFDAERFPRIHFVSRPLDPGTIRAGGRLIGALTMHGHTRTVHFTLLPSGCDEAALDGCTLRVVGAVQRYDFGMHKRRGLVSNTVTLDLDIHLLSAPASPVSIDPLSSPR